mmetsp:Transcript_115768/g.374071  ORF Transcript_115768/g.374071 Transcript_115768/m.374071 type:complete len:282 (-) Transcript_115768:92-937(-)
MELPAARLPEPGLPAAEQPPGMLSVTKPRTAEGLAAEPPDAAFFELPMCSMPVTGTGASLSAEEEAQARLIFECFDSDGSGNISVTEFAALLVKDKRVAAFMGLRGGRQEAGGRRTSADDVFRELCGSGRQELSWPAFRRFATARRARAAAEAAAAARSAPGHVQVPDAAPPQLLPEEEGARLIFELIDTDKNGQITCAELAAACVMRPQVAEFVARASCGAAAARGRRLSGADLLFREIDTDGDRAISMAEFLSFFARSGEGHKGQLRSTEKAVVAEGGA